MLAKSCFRETKSWSRLSAYQIQINPSTTKLSISHHTINRDYKSSAEMQNKESARRPKTTDHLDRNRDTPHATRRPYPVVNPHQRVIHLILSLVSAVPRIRYNQRQQLPTCSSLLEEQPLLIDNAAGITISRKILIRWQAGFHRYRAQSMGPEHQGSA